MKLMSCVLVMVTVPLLGLLVACGGGDGGGGATDLTGWWELSSKETGSPGPYADETLAQAAQTGTTVWMGGLEFTLSGSTLSYVDTGGGVWTFTVVSNDLLQGTWEATVLGTPISADVQGVRKPAPTGTLQVDGTSAAGVVAMNSTTAFALVEDEMFGGTRAYHLTLVNSEPMATTEVNLTHVTTPPAGLLTGVAYTVGGPGDVQLSLFETIAGVDTETVATAGTVTFTVIDASRAAGSFTATLGGNPLTGSFDTPILYTQTDP